MKASHPLCLFVILLYQAVRVASAETGVPDSAVIEAAQRLDAALEKVLTAQEEERKSSEGRIPPFTPPSQADDLAFFRRASIDLTGKLPTADELKDFEQDRSPQKRPALLHRLHTSPAAAEWRFQRLADAFRLKDEDRGRPLGAYVEWLRQAAHEDRPWNVLFKQLITARGSLEENPAAGFKLRDSDYPQVTATESARAFLGENIHCAACHDDPFGPATQMGYWQFAACFSDATPPTAPASRSVPKTLLPGATPIGRKARDQASPAAPWRHTLRLPSIYRYRDGKPGDPVNPAFLPLESGPYDTFSRKPSIMRPLSPQVAEWFVSPRHGRLSQTAALRVWGWMFGSPGIGAAEQRRLREGPAVPVTPAEVQQRLSCDQPFAVTAGLESLRDWQLDDRSGFAAALRREFDACGQRIGYFQYIVAHTQAYQKEAISSQPYRLTGIWAFTAAPLVRRLPPEVTWEALASWIAKNPEHPELLPASSQPQVPPPDHPLRVLGRGSREWADESLPAISHRLSRLMMNHAAVASATAGSGLLVSGAKKQSSASQQVTHLFLDTLGRTPLESESAAAEAFLQTHPDQGLPGIAWALINTSEFLFHH